MVSALIPVKELIFEINCKPQDIDSVDCRPFTERSVHSSVEIHALIHSRYRKQTVCSTVKFQ